MTGAEPTLLATFATEVRAHRNRRGWSQVALGEKIGYSGSFGRGHGHSARMADRGRVGGRDGDPGPLV